MVLVFTETTSISWAVTTRLLIDFVLDGQTHFGFFSRDKLQSCFISATESHTSTESCLGMLCSTWMTTLSRYGEVLWHIGEPPNRHAHAIIPIGAWDRKPQHAISIRKTNQNPGSRYVTVSQLTTKHHLSEIQGCEGHFTKCYKVGLRDRSIIQGDSG